MIDVPFKSWNEWAEEEEFEDLDDFDIDDYSDDELWTILKFFYPNADSK